MRLSFKTPTLGLITATAITLGGQAQAVTFTSATGTFSFLNLFGGLGPSDLTEFSFTSTVESAIDAPSIVGAPLSFDIMTDAFSAGLRSDPFLGRFDPEGDVFEGSFSLGTFGRTVGEFAALPDIDSVVEFPDGSFEFTFGGVFAEFDPVIGDFPEVTLYATYEFDAPLPTRLWVLFCEASDPDICETSTVDDPASVSLIDPQLAAGAYYVEGSVTGRITLSTSPDAPMAPVPVPAAGLLLLAGLGGLGLARKR